MPHRIAIGLRPIRICPLLMLGLPTIRDLARPGHALRRWRHRHECTECAGPFGPGSLLPRPLRPEPHEGAKLSDAQLAGAVMVER
eukprot:scaffold100686_cov63-Phaeocystis_antarctica.AAC.3